MYPDKNQNNWLGLCASIIRGRAVEAFRLSQQPSACPWAFVFLGLLFCFSSCQKETGVELKPLHPAPNTVNSSTSTPTPRPKLPIEYMAEQNVAPSGVVFTEGGLWHESGYFTYQEAIGIKIAGYHLPTPEEMNGILPTPHAKGQQSNANGYPKVYVGNPKFNAAPPILIRDDAEHLQIGNERLVCTSLYGVVGAYTGRRVSYALRFFDEGERKYYSAFRYEVQRLSRKTRLDDALSAYRLQVRVRYLGKDSPLRPTVGDMELVCSEGFWAKGGEHDIVRYLPNCGFIFDPASPETRPAQLSTVGRYWLKESEDEGHKRYRYLEISNSSTGMDSHELFPRMPVRLFQNE